MSNSYRDFLRCVDVYHDVLHLINNIEYTTDDFDRLQKIRKYLHNRLKSYAPSGHLSRKLPQVVVARVPHNCKICGEAIVKNDHYYRRTNTSFCLSCGKKEFGIMHSYNFQRY